MNSIARPPSAPQTKAAMSLAPEHAHRPIAQLLALTLALTLLGTASGLAHAQAVAESVPASAPSSAPLIAQRALQEKCK